MAASTTWLNATLVGTAGGVTLFTYGGLNNSTGPSTTGANDIGSARQSITWSAAASASSATSNSQSWSVAASTSGIGWIGLWNASTSGTYEADIVLTSTVSFSTAGTLTAASAAVTFSASDST
jgi:hypothetical protein